MCKVIEYQTLYDDIKNLIRDYDCPNKSKLKAKFKHVYSGYYVHMKKYYRKRISKSLNLSKSIDLIFYDRKTNDMSNFSAVSIFYESTDLTDTKGILNNYSLSISDSIKLFKDKDQNFLIIKNFFTIYLTRTSACIGQILDSFSSDNLISIDYKNELISKVNTCSKQKGLFYCLTFEASFNQDVEQPVDSSTLHFDYFSLKPHNDVYMKVKKS